MPQLALRPNPRPEGGPALTGTQAMEQIGKHMARGEQIRIVLENLDGEKFVHYGTPRRATRKSNSIGFSFDSRGRDPEAERNDPDAKPLPRKIGTLYTVGGDSRFVGVNRNDPLGPKQTYRVLSVESAREFLEKQNPKERPELAAKLNPVSVMRYEIVRDPDVPQQSRRNTTSPYYVEVYKKFDDAKTPDVDERSELLYRIPLMNGAEALHPGYIEGARPIGGGRWLLDVGAKWDHGLNKPVIAIKADYNRAPGRGKYGYQSGLVNLDRIVLDKEGWPVRAEMEVGRDHTFEKPKKIEPKIPSVDMSRFEVESNPYGRPGLPGGPQKPGGPASGPNRPAGQGPRPSSAPGAQQGPPQSPDEGQGQSQNPDETQQGPPQIPDKPQGQTQAPTESQSQAEPASQTSVPELTPQQATHFSVINTMVGALAQKMGRSSSNPDSAAMVHIDEEGLASASIITADGRVSTKKPVPDLLSRSMNSLGEEKALAGGGAFWAFNESGVVAFMSRNSRQINAYQVDAIDTTYRDIYLEAAFSGVKDMQGKWFDVAVDTKTDAGRIIERVSPLSNERPPENGFTRVRMQGTLTSSGEFILRIPKSDNTYSYVGYSPSSAASDAFPPRFPKALRGRTALSGGDYDPRTGQRSTSDTLPQIAPRYTALSNPSHDSGASLYPLYLAPSAGGPQFRTSESSISLLRETTELQQTMTSLMFGLQSRDEAVTSLREAQDKIARLSNSTDETSVSRTYANYLSEKLIPSIIEKLGETADDDQKQEMGVASASLRHIDRSMRDLSAEMLGIAQIDAGRMQEFYKLLSREGFGTFDKDSSLIKSLANVLDTRHVGIVVKESDPSGNDGP